METDQPGPDVPSGDAAPPAPDPAARASRRRLVIGLVAVLVVAAVVGVLILVVGKKVEAAIATGSGTATVTWTPAHPGGASTSFTPQSFSGSINGNSLTGVATSPLASSSSNPFTPGSTAKAELFRYRGTYDGKPYTIGVFLQGPLSGTDPSVQFSVSGTYGDQPVRGVIGPAPANSTSAAIPFHGTIGDWKVSGTLHGPTGTAQQQTATAQFTVSR